jgi:predicted AAA+ superfamily ATPase
MSLDPFLFQGMQLPAPLVDDIRRFNPWWESKPMPVLPKTRRHLVRQVATRLERKLAPIIVVRGPRQVGKTTAQMHLIGDLLASGVDPKRMLRVQCDELPGLTSVGRAEPVLRIADWYEKAVLKRSLNEAAHAGEPVYLFFDELQNLKAWAPQLKSLVDHSTVSVVVTGSSALRIGLGQDSLAGRIATVEAGVLSLTEIGDFAGLNVGDPFLPDNGLEVMTHADFWRDLAAHGSSKAEARDEAFARFSERGGYPLAQARYDVPWEHVADQLNDTVIRRVIQHDLRVGEVGRKRDARLLEEVFRLSCRYVGQCPSYATLAREAQRSLQANVGPQRAHHYLRFLNDTLLLRLIPPLEIRLKRSRGFPRICLVDHGLRASWLQEQVPLAPERLRQEPHLTTMAGHLAESVTGSLLATIGGLDLAHLPTRADMPEVDFVLTIGAKRIPLEVKYQRAVDPLRDTEGLRAFVETAANNAPFGILVTQTPVALADPRIVSLPLSSLMLLR